MEGSKYVETKINDTPTLRSPLPESIFIQFFEIGKSVIPVKMAPSSIGETAATTDKDSQFVLGLLTSVLKNQKVEYPTLHIHQFVQLFLNILYGSKLIRKISIYKMMPVCYTGYLHLILCCCIFF